MEASAPNQKLVASKNPQVEPRICRVSLTLQYLTPTKKRNILEITFQNISREKAAYFYLQANAFLPRLRIRDSNNRNLMVIPRYLLPNDLGRDEYAMLIQLKEAIKSGDFETIRVEWMSTVINANKLPHEKYLFAYTSDEFKPFLGVPLSSECSWYISIFAPKGYELNVSQKNEGCKDTYQDESSFVMRFFTKKAPTLSAIIIRIPSRVTQWLIMGTMFTFILPLLAATAYLANNLTLCFTIIFGTTAAILAMRTWLFYSVELLDRNNKIYLMAFIFNVTIAVLVLLFYIQLPQLIATWWQNMTNTFG